MLNRAGNDHINSLLEFSPPKNTNQMIDKFINEKYTKKMFLNRIEIDYTINYVKELNKILYLNVKGPCLPITIYNLFLGANKNIIKSNKTLYDEAEETNQEAQMCYLKLNEAISYDKIDQSILDYLFEGEITQVIGLTPNSNVTKESLNIRLDQQFLTLQNFNSNTLTKKMIQIRYSSIIKIVSHFRNNAIEIKWCNERNNSLISSYFEYSQIHENKIWMKEFFVKLFSSFHKNSLFKKTREDLNSIKLNYSILIDLIDCCQINMIGFLQLVNSTHDVKEQVFLILVETLASQEKSFFKRVLILMRKSNTNEQFYDLIDLRKVDLKYNTNLLRIDLKNKIYLLESNGYIQNLETWYERLKSATEMNSNTIEDQYLTKDNVPIYMEKCCSFAEFKLINQDDLYSANSSTLRSNIARSQSLARKLLEDKNFDLSSDEPSPGLILALFKEFFNKYFETKYLALLLRGFSDLFDINNFQNFLIEQSSNPHRSYLETINSITVNFDKFESLLQKIQSSCPIFYHTFKRICIHLKLVSKFKKNLNVINLSDLFSGLFFDLKNFSNSDKPFFNLLQLLKENFKISIEPDYCLKIFLCKIIELSILNCVELFGLKKDYMIIQEKMIEKSLEMRNNSVFKSPFKIEKKNILLTIYFEDKKMSQSFQLNADTSLTCKSVLNSCIQMFKLNGSDNWSLFEVFDHQQHRLMSSILPSNLQTNKANTFENQLPLKRALTNDSKILEVLSTWSSFYVCVKLSDLQTDHSLENLCSMNGFNAIYESKMMLFCEICGCFKVSDVSNLNVRECSSLLHKRWSNSYLSLFKDSVKIYKKFLENSKELSKFKADYDIKLDSCVIYYGCYQLTHEIITDKDLNNSLKGFNLEECITIYDKRMKNLFCLNLYDKEKALQSYIFLNKMSQNQAIQNPIDLNNNLDGNKRNPSNDLNSSLNSLTKFFDKIFKK